MKNKKIGLRPLYYALPFATVPASLMLCELFDNTGVLKMSPLLVGGVLLALSALLGFLSSSDKEVDLLITLLMPVSLFGFMFLAGFLDAGDLGARFQLGRAMDVSFQPFCVMLYVLMASVTLFFSLRFFRNLIRGRERGSV